MLTFPESSRRWLVRACLVGFVFASAASVWSAASSGPSAARLLSAELPAGVALDKVGCEPLARAVYRTVRAHRPQASGILTAALTGGRAGNQPKVTFSCECVRVCFRAAVRADPSEAATLLEQTISLCPSCADTLQREAQATSDKDVVDDPKDVRPGHPAAGDDRFDPTVRDGVPPASDVSNAPDGFDTPNDLYGGFGVGFGPGFPGSPGFTGSPPGGAIALPPATVVVTSVING